MMSRPSTRLRSIMLEVGERRLGLPLGVAQHQVVALLEAVTLHPAHHLGEEGVAGGGDQHADTVGLLHLETAGHQAWGIVELAHGGEDPLAGLLGDEAGLVDDVGDGGGRHPRQRRHLLDIGHQCPCAVCSSRKASTSCLLGMELWAPNRVTESAAAPWAKCTAASKSAPANSAASKAPLKVSPAAVVSTAFTRKPGMSACCCPLLQ